MSAWDLTLPSDYSAPPPCSREFRPAWSMLSRAYHPYSNAQKGHFCKKLLMPFLDSFRRENTLSFPPWHSGLRHRLEPPSLPWNRAKLRFPDTSNSDETGRQLA